MAKLKPASDSSLTVLFGVGRMGCAMAEGWLNAPADGPARRPLALIEPDPSDAVLALADMDGVTLNPPPQPAATLVLAIKPQAFADSSEQIVQWCHAETCLVSIMAGIQMQDMQQRLGVSKIARVMSNLPSALGLGISAWCCTQDAANDGDQISQLLAPFGAVEGPVSEQAMDTITALSGCGPAYLFLLADSMYRAGHALGLDKAIAARLTTYTLYGSASMLLNSDAEAQDLAKHVASPGGATEAALNILLKDQNFERLIEAAMQAARDRSAELSGN